MREICAIRELREICENINIGSQDLITWGGSMNHSLGISDIWDSKRTSGVMPLWFNFVWCKFKVPKFAFTTWLVVLERLLTKDRMRNFHMHVDLGCVMCGAANESHAHLFSQCPYVQSIFTTWNDSLSTSWSDLCCGNILSDMRCGDIQKELAYLFVSAVFFHIWKERNIRVHNSGIHSDAATLLGIIKRNIRERLVGSKSLRKIISNDFSLTSYLY